MGYSKQRFSCYDVKCWKMTQKVDQNETSFSTVVANALRKKEKKNTQIISCAHENL